MPPLVSFVIPVKNDATRLRRCLGSIVANDYPRDRVEIIVVDNDSSDGSAQAAIDAGATVMISQASSVAELRNSGAQRARGRILAFVDADHVIDRRWLLSAVDALADESVSAAGAHYHTDPSPNWVQRQYDAMRHRLTKREDVSWLGSGNLAVKRAAFDAVHGFDTSLSACEDVDLCNRLRLAGHRIVAEPGMGTIHFGDPRTLKAVFWGELWRGRDNVRVTFRGPKTFALLRSALIPIINLASIVTGAVALLLGYYFIALVCGLIVLGFVGLRALALLRRQPGPSLQACAQAIAFSAVFDLARALALVAQGSHRARRSA